MKKIAVMLLLSVLLLSAVSAYVNRGYHNEILVYSLRNDADTTARTSITTYDYESNSYGSSGEIKIKSGKNARAYVMLEEDMKEGCYPLLVRLSDEGRSVQRQKSWVCVY